MLRDLLRLQGVEVGRRHVGTLMRRMGIQALYRKPNTSKRHPAHPVFAYLLRGLAIERADQVWALDITYIPMSRSAQFMAAMNAYDENRNEEALRLMESCAEHGDPVACYLAALWYRNGEGGRLI